MKIGVSVSPEMFAAIKRQSKLRLISESHVVREIVAKALGEKSDLPRRVYPREPRLCVSLFATTKEL